MASRRSPRERLQERKKALEKMHAEIKELTKQEAERIGRLAIEAGLADIDASDDRLTEEFQQLAARLGTTSSSTIEDDRSVDGS